MAKARHRFAKGGDWKVAPRAFSTISGDLTRYMYHHGSFLLLTFNVSKLIHRKKMGKNDIIAI